MLLSLDDHMVEQVSAVVDRRIGEDFDVTGFRVDFHFGNVAAVRKGLRRFRLRLGVEAFRNLTALFHLGGSLRQLEKRNAAIGADHFETAGPIGDVGFGGLQDGCRNRLALRQHGSRRS